MRIQNLLTNAQKVIGDLPDDVDPIHVAVRHGGATVHLRWDDFRRVYHDREVERSEHSARQWKYSVSEWADTVEVFSLRERAHRPINATTVRLDEEAA